MRDMDPTSEIYQNSDLEEATSVSFNCKSKHLNNSRTFAYVIVFRFSSQLSGVYHNYENINKLEVQ